MLYKDICGAPRKDLAYDSVKGLDEALKEWRDRVTIGVLASQRVREGVQADQAARRHRERPT